MGIFTRLFMFFYSLSIIAASLVGIVIFGRFLPDSEIANELLYLGTRWETLGVLILLLILSVYFFIQVFSFGPKDNISANEALIVTGKAGEVNISIQALKNMAHKLAEQVAGVRDVKVRLKLKRTNLAEQPVKPCFKLILTVSETRNIVDISDEIKQSVQTYMQDFIGIKDLDVDVHVDKVSSEKSKDIKRVV